MRIVSLCPSTTETLVDLGLASSLVGITRFCVHPAEVVAGIAKVGGTKSPKLDRIRALAPDLVLLNEEENRREDYEALRGELRVETSFPRSVAEIPEHLRWLGRLVGAEAAAEARARAVEGALAELEALRAARPEAAFRFVYLIWREPWMAAGPDTYVDDLLARAGGRNVVRRDEGRYPEVHLDALEARRPDVVLLPDEPFPFGDEHVLEVAARVPSARVEPISGDDACWHGVRSLRGLALARALHLRHARVAGPEGAG